VKIIFLDIDGVLNSRQYDLTRNGEDGNIDQSRLPLLKQLVDQTGGRIVLTSTWRIHLGADEIGRELEEMFLQEGLVLYDKTPQIQNDREKEITAWLADHQEVTAFVIFDDIKFGWGALAPMVVNTDYRIGRGLEQRHIEKAKEILEK